MPHTQSVEGRGAFRGLGVRLPVLPTTVDGMTIDFAMATTILIVDDHVGFRSCARELLTSDGFEIVGEADDAASAVAAARELRPDVVLLDIQLPDFDGVEASKQIAALHGRSAIVLISSRDVTDLGAALAESPARGFIPKSELSGAALRELLL
jgi:DNA-binding NarL/FixJ family response regulator